MFYVLTFVCLMGSCVLPDVALSVNGSIYLDQSACNSAAATLRAQIDHSIQPACEARVSVGPFKG